MQADRSVGAVILAAGASRRYGSPKQLVLVDSRMMLEHVAETASAAGLAPVIVVVPAWLSPPAGLDPSVPWIRNAFPERGVSLSLRLGFTAIPADVAAAMILLGDQPGIQASTIAAVLGARGDRPIVAASAEGVLAPPVLIERTHFGLVDELTGDIGLRHLLREYPRLVTPVAVPGHAADIDTPADLGHVSGP